MAKFKVTVNTDAYKCKRCSKKNWKPGTRNDFVEECRSHEDLARELFDFVDWQHPNIQDLLDGYDDEEFEERYGFSMEALG